MRIVGWCLGCKRTTTVEVTSTAVARAAVMGGAMVGRCDECQERQDDDKRSEQ